MRDWEPDISLFLHQTAMKLLYKTPFHPLQLNSVAYQHYLSIFKSLVALTFNNKLPQETGEGFCVVFLSMGDRGLALDRMFKLWRLVTCVMNSKL